jgi:uroporphyrinogen III methyltransferase/synthase
MVRGVQAKKHGKVWLVGAGPGDPDLITVRGLNVLRAAEVVLYDALSHPALLEQCAQSAELRDVGKRGGQYSPDQEWITSQLIDLAHAGKRVVRLKGGDSFLFARGAEEALALSEAGVDFEIVPGLSSPLATSAYAGISLTHRELSSSVTFITGSDRAGKEWSPEAWHKLATASDTLCILMGMRKLRQISEALIAGGRAATTPAAVVQWGARPEQRVVETTLSALPDAVQAAGLTNPAVIVVGDVVTLRNQLRWYDNRPLFGKRILIPRPANQAQETARAIRERAAEAITFPVIEIHDIPDTTAIDRAIAALASYDFTLFTSHNGVERFFAALDRLGLDARAFGTCKIGVIGPKTGAALARHGLKPDLIAEEFVAESLAESILKRAPRRVLIARALVARNELPKLLRAAGVTTDVLPVYETRFAGAARKAELRDWFVNGALDVVLLTSSSTVSSLVDLLGADAQALLARVVVASIGPITTKTATERGLRVDLTANEYTIEGLLDALEACFSSPDASFVRPKRESSPSAKKL